MANFHYEALNSDGETVRGMCQAADASAAIALLRDQELSVLSIRLESDRPDASSARSTSVGEGVALVSDFESSRRSQLTQQAYLQRITHALNDREQLLPLLEAFAAEQSSTAIASEIRAVANRISGGVTAEEFVRDPHLSSWLPVVMQAPGSDEMIDGYAQLISQMADEGGQRRSSRAALSYPAVLTAFAIATLGLVCVVVVPGFQTLFRDFGLRLPSITLMLVGLSSALREQPLTVLLWTLGILVISVLVIRLWISRGWTTQFFGAIISGSSTNVLAMSRFASVLASLLEAKAPLADAVRIAGVACRHPYYRVAAAALANDVDSRPRGWRESSVSHNFPETLLMALDINDRTQASAAILRELATLYGDQVRLRMAISPGVGSPLLLLLIGGLIGLVVVALFAPLVAMISSLS